MAIIRQAATGLAIGDPDLIPLSGAAKPKEGELDEVLGKLILSASGWRTVFARDGDEESRETEIGGSRQVVAATAASVFAAISRQRRAEAIPW
jgi:hypothetical protein